MPLQVQDKHEETGRGWGWCSPRPPPPRVLTWAGSGSGGQKCGNTGSRCLDKPVLPGGTDCGPMLQT